MTHLIKRYMEKYITKEMFPELVASCWEAGICVDFEPTTQRAWLKMDGVYEYIHVIDKVTTQDIIECFKTKVEQKQQEKVREA